MMKYALIVLTFLVGAIIPVQAVLNSRMGKQTGGSLMGAFISFLVGLICLLIINLVMNPSALINIKPASTGPWYLWLGGVIGAIFVAYIAWINQQQGVALTFALVVSGQICASLMIDHFGLFGAIVQPISMNKIIGAALIIAGIIFIKK